MTKGLFFLLNRALFLIVLGISGYLLFSPLFPYAEQYFARAQQTASPVGQLPVSGTGAGDRGDPGLGNEFFALRDIEVGEQDFRIIIPSIGVDTSVLEGENPRLVDEGIWHRPNSSLPILGSNTVLVGHRYQYLDGAKSFFFLPDVEPGEFVYVHWDGGWYVYEIQSESVVSPSAIEVEAKTNEPILTLYTCTPVWSAENRHVVRSVLVGGISDEELQEGGVE